MEVRNEHSTIQIIEGALYDLRRTDNTVHISRMADDVRRSLEEDLGNENYVAVRYAYNHTPKIELTDGATRSTTTSPVGGGSFHLLLLVRRFWVMIVARAGYFEAVVMDTPRA